MVIKYSEWLVVIIIFVNSNPSCEMAFMLFFKLSFGQCLCGIKLDPQSCRPTVFRQVADFANVFKAFIGTNWIGLPFAFKESGIVVRVIIFKKIHVVACMYSPKPFPLLLPLFFCPLAKCFEAQSVLVYLCRPLSMK